MSPPNHAKNPAITHPNQMEEQKQKIIQGVNNYVKENPWQIGYSLKGRYALNRVTGEAVFDEKCDKPPILDRPNRVKLEYEDPGWVKRWHPVSNEIFWKHNTTRKIVYECPPLKKDAKPEVPLPRSLDAQNVKATESNWGQWKNVKQEDQFYKPILKKEPAESYKRGQTAKEIRQKELTAMLDSAWDEPVAKKSKFSE